MPKRSEMTITKRTVDGLSVEGKEAVFWDRELPGFGVRVYPSGTKIYLAQSRGPSGIRRVSFGRNGTITAEQARKQAAAAIARIKQGEDLVSAEPERAVTVADLATRYMEGHVEVHCNAHTQRIYAGSLRNHILPAFGAMPLASVGRAEVAAFHFGLRETPRAANRALMVLSKMFSLSEAWGLAPPGGNPCRFVLRYKERRRERFLTEDEYRRVGHALCELESRGPLQVRAAAAPWSSDADGVPARGGADAQMERRGPQGGGAPAARREDGCTDGAADAGGVRGVGGNSPCQGGARGYSRRAGPTATCRRSRVSGTGCGSAPGWRT